LALDPENVQTLCEPCNIGKGDRDQTDWRSAA
jgi:5-methylcytosine-specific restriction endonuclease McrA